MAKTNFLHKYNTDDVHSRAVIIGLVNLLNTRVQYTNVLSDTNVDVVTVPFFYSMTGDERFLQDYFLEWNDCIHPKIADGNYDVIPRGIVTLTGNTINTSAMTHRFVRGSYVKEINGQLQTFNAFLNPIPLSMTFDVQIETDTNLDAFKIQQSIIETFYKTQVYSVSYKGFRVPCQVGFPEDYGLDKTFEFTYQSDAKIQIKFSLTVETYLPVVDPTTERKNSNRITSQGGPGLGLAAFNDKAILGFTFNTPTPNATYFSGSTLPISWTNTGTILRNNIYYRFSGLGGDWLQMARSSENIGSYDWSIPFLNISGDVVANDPIRATVNSSTGKGAKVRAIIDANGEVEKIVIFDSGFAYSSEDTIEVSPLILPPPGVASFVGPTITVNVQDGRVIGYTIINPGSGFEPTPTNYIELKIESDVDESIFQVYETSFFFKGDTDPFFDPLGPGMKQIKNINPSVADLIAQGINLVDQTISGPGTEIGSKILSADAINNLLVIDKDVTLLITDGEYSLEKQTAIFEIQ
jgi:hypothetical protein